MERTGIGCKHIFKVIITKNMDLTRAIQSQWIIDPETELKNKLDHEEKQIRIKRGPPKVTRRNIIP